MIQSLFISKNIEDVPELAQFCQEHTIELHAHSLIQFQPLPFQYDQQCDCIFFSSPRSAHYFLSKNSISTELIAVAGETTKREVESFGYSVDFVPKNSGLVRESSQQFAEWLGTKTVLFPVSSISNKSYASSIPDERVSFLEIYETQLVPQLIAECDMYVFTSPSNVESFFEKNVVSDHATIIAWGESTSNYLLNSRGVKSVILKNSYVETLTRVIIKQKQCR